MWCWYSATTGATLATPSGDEVDVFRPVNTAGLVGHSIVLPCSSLANNDSRWDFYSHHTNKPTSVYNGVGVHDNSGRRLNLDYDSCRLKACNISIASLQFGDAGYYVCFEASRPKKVGAALVILGTLLFYSLLLLSFLPYLLPQVGTQCVYL